MLQNFGSLTKLKNATEAELNDFLGAEKGKLLFRQMQTTPENFEPFIVPIRFDDPNGNAADLRPLDLPEKLYRKSNGEKIGGGGRNRTDE